MARAPDLGDAVAMLAASRGVRFGTISFSIHEGKVLGMTVSATFKSFELAGLMHRSVRYLRDEDEGGREL